MTMRSANDYDYCNTTSVAIPDRGSVDSTIDDVEAFEILSLDVEIHITHPRPSDLTVTLTSPARRHGLAAAERGQRGELQRSGRRR